ncbi:MAG: uridine kinase [Acidobacteriota bacterium]|nr:MAG: uridine kinase [Acidobacteriota bacterium]
MKKGTGSFLIGVAGGSGSGKTTLVAKLIDELGQEKVARIEQDAYYRDLSHLPLEEREQVNFDHPDALESVLLSAHLKSLRDGVAIETPCYDFTIHTRTEQTIAVSPAPVVFVEGTLILAIPAVVELLDLKVFVETTSEIRLARRIARDINERGRTRESVLEQYRRNVKPMHEQFVEPSSRRAHLIVRADRDLSVATQTLARGLKSML